jgi:hypothetical protein
MLSLRKDMMRPFRLVTLRVTECLCDHVLGSRNTFGADQSRRLVGSWVIGN